MFDQQQFIYLVDADGATYQLGYVENKNFGSKVVDFCKSYSANHVHLFGVTEYADHYADSIRRAEKTNYATSNINIEIN
jgi:hypothetical protein